jgi:hypothetical protein
MPFTPRGGGGGILWWVDMQADGCSGPPGLTCVDQAVLVGMRRPTLGPTLHRRHALYGPCVSRTGSCPSVCGRQTLAELYIQDIGPRMLPSSAAPGREPLVGIHAAPSHVALFAHMVLSIAPFVASTSVYYVRLTSKLARCLHIINVPQLHTL